MVSSSSATTAGFPVLQPKIDSEVAAWLANERKISLPTLAKLPVASGITFFPELNRKSRAVFFKYAEGWKARAVPEKAFVSGPGTKASFWNLEAVLQGKMDRVYLTEGELDACALVEAGFTADAVLSAPSGTTGEHSYVAEALKAGLAKAKRFVFCGDTDEVGLRLRAEMAQILGTAKMFFVEWPEGCKDANDFLRSDGPQAVLELVRDGALPWPVDGLYRLDELPEQAPLVCWQIGFEDRDRLINNKIQLAAGTLSIVTGHPGHGKTMLFSQIWYNVVRRHDLIACVASFETRPKPHLRRMLRTLYGQRLETHLLNDYPEIVDMADVWINEHYLFAVHPERRPNLGWLMDKAEVAVVRHGAQILQIDPWNRLEGSRERNENETDYIGRCLRELYNFAVDFNCHVQIIAHPAKSDGMRRGKPPELEDIHGSRHWENMTDQGFVVHRDRLFYTDKFGVVRRETKASLYHKKARFEELGYPTKLHFDFDIDCGRYGLIEPPKPKEKSNDGAPDDE